jgi:hypothetical protein
MRTYKAIVWGPNEGEPGKHVEVAADNLADAKAKLESQFGRATPFAQRGESPLASPQYNIGQ